MSNNDHTHLEKGGASRSRSADNEGHLSALENSAESLDKELFVLAEMTTTGLRCFVLVRGSVRLLLGGRLCASSFFNLDERVEHTERMNWDGKKD